MFLVFILPPDFDLTRSLISGGVTTLGSVTK
jgi:hypothetical protein